MEVEDAAGVGLAEHGLEAGLEDGKAEGGKGAGRQADDEGTREEVGPGQRAPMDTPPARVALAMSAGEILRRRSNPAKYVASVAPQRARITLMAVCGTSWAGTRAEQKLGQKTQRTMLPSRENRSETASDSMGASNSVRVVIVRIAPRPKKAPKA